MYSKGIVYICGMIELVKCDNGCVEIERLPSRKTNSGKYRSMSKWRCFCGNEFLRRRDKSKNTNMSCGCAINASKITHGLSGRKIYKIWSGMKRRLFDKNNIAYERYKDLGMEESWINDAAAFVDYVSGLEGYDESNIGRGSKNISLDRIDSAKGYFKGNLRWTSRKVQARNQRIPKNNKSGYIGVSALKDGRFSANITVNYKRKTVGIFDTPEEANEARIAYIKSNKLEDYSITPSKSSKKLNKSGKFVRVEKNIYSNGECFKVSVYSGGGMVEEYFDTIDDAREYLK